MAVGENHREKTTITLSVADHTDHCSPYTLTLLSLTSTTLTMLSLHSDPALSVASLLLSCNKYPTQKSSNFSPYYIHTMFVRKTHIHKFEMDQGARE